MGVRVEANAEPIPGYRLIERLGGGGFGEVWKAEAPGGLFKAIKFVYGDLQAAGDDGCRAEQELKGLSRVKSVHHPYILSLERFDIIDGQLIIVMELADRTIWDRFQEVRGQGLPGIPRTELLDYLRETAEALDLMNIEYQLQHLDIKPQNLFLNRNHVKVADFGLVKDLEGMNGATVTGGVTPVYAAPETFDGRISRFSDQYSLAIVYQELLTGVRPFAGSTMRQLILQHLQGTPNVEPLPVADRVVILRALAKNPDERFPSCIEMIKALEGTKPGQAGPAAAPIKEKDKAAQQEDVEITQGVVRGKKERVEAEPEASQPVQPGSTTEQGLQAPGVHDTPAPRPMPKKGKAARPKAPTKATVHDGVPSMPPSRPFAEKRADAAEEEAGTGILQPGLVIGLGQMGIDTLRQVRRMLNEEFGLPEALPHLRLLALDTDPEAVQAAGQGEMESRLRPSEMLHTSLHRPSHYLKGNDSKSILDGWLNSRMIYRIPRQPTQAGSRSLGRLAFVDNYRAIYRRLEAELQACCSEDTLHELSQHTDVGMRTRVPRVYIVSSLSGTTGGGMFLDVAYVVRQMLRRLGHPSAEVVGIFFLPLVGSDPVRMRALANTYAALTELQYFSTGLSVFRARFASVEPVGPSIKSFTEAGPPFHRSYLLNLPEPRPGSLSSVRDATEVVGQASAYIFRDLATPLGKELEIRRRERPELLGPQYHSFGLCRLVWPRRQIIEKAGRNLCRRLIDRWLSKDASGMKDEIRTWSGQEWESHGFRVENLIAQHHEKCEALLKQSPENLFGQIIAPLAEQLAKPPKPPKPGRVDELPCLNVGPAVQAMDQLEKLLGLPEECRPKGPAPEPSVIEKALAEVAGVIADGCDKKLAELVVRHLIEEPRFRLAGAEEALRQFSAIAEQSLQAHEQLAKELAERTIALYQKIHRFFDTPVSTVKPQTSMWKGAFSRRTPAESLSPGAELVELLRSYAKCRYQSMVLHHITCLYVSLRGLLSDQVREVGFCRTRLTELRGLVDGTQQQLGQPAGPAAASGRERNLLPEGCVDLKDAINLVNEEISQEDLLEFDHVVQQLLQEQFQALVHVCMGPTSMVKSLSPALLHEAMRFLEPRLAGTNAAEMYLAQHSKRGEVTPEIKDELTAFFAAAAPPLTKNAEGADISIITLPSGPAGDRLRNYLHTVLHGAYILTAPPPDEVLFFRERGPMALQDLDQLGPAGEQAYEKYKRGDPAALHTREDIPEWLEVES